MWNPIFKNDTNELTQKTDLQTSEINFWLPKENCGKEG